MVVTDSIKFLPIPRAWAELPSPGDDDDENVGEIVAPREGCCHFKLPHTRPVVVCFAISVCSALCPATLSELTVSGGGGRQPDSGEDDIAPAPETSAFGMQS